MISTKNTFKPSSSGPTNDNPRLQTSRTSSAGGSAQLNKTDLVEKLYRLTTSSGEKSAALPSPPTPTVSDHASSTSLLKLQKAAVYTSLLEGDYSAAQKVATQTLRLRSHATEPQLLLAIAANPRDPEPIAQLMTVLCRNRKWQQLAQAQTLLKRSTATPAERVGIAQAAKDAGNYKPFVRELSDTVTEFTWPDKQSYVGTTQEGRAHGVGKLYNDDDNAPPEAWRKYCGEFSHGYPHGHGILKFADWELEGEFRFGELHGEAVKVVNGEKVLCTVWNDGELVSSAPFGAAPPPPAFSPLPIRGKAEVAVRKDGRSQITWSNGESYIGQARGAIPHGWGTLDNTFSGTWDNGKPLNGIAYTYDNGVKGQWEIKNGKQVGRAKIFDDNGLLYDGMSKGYLRHGFGASYDDAEKCSTKPLYCWGPTETAYKEKLSGMPRFLSYEGNWLRGVRNGVGSAYNTDQKCTYKGEWVDGEQKGQGKEGCPGGYREGSFQDGTLNGQGVQYTTEGKKEFEGSFNDGAWRDGTWFRPNGGTIKGTFFGTRSPSDAREFDNVGRLTYDGKFFGGRHDGQGTEFYYEDGDKQHFAKFTGWFRMNERSTPGQWYDGAGDEIEMPIKFARKDYSRFAPPRSTSPGFTGNRQAVNDVQHYQDLRNTLR